MNNTMNLDGFATNDVEYEVGFNNEDTITRALELIISWYSTKQGMSFKVANALIKHIDKSRSIRWTVVCNPVED